MCESTLRSFTDLKNDNFLVTLDNVEETVHNALQATRPVVYPTIQRKGAQPITYVISQPIYPIMPNDGTAPITIKIADFGVSECYLEPESLGSMF